MESNMTAVNATTSSMVTECPRCRARYRVEPARLGPEGAKLRCSRCQAVFRVAPPPAPAAAAAPRAGAAAEPARPVAAAPAPPAADAPVVLVAAADPDLAKRRAALLGSLGLRTLCAADGVEAILAIQRHRPVAALLDARLERMSTPELCELAKRNESLRAVKLIRIGADDARARDRYADAREFGPDADLDANVSAADLARELARQGLSVRMPEPAAPPVAAPARAAAAGARPSSAASAPPAAPVSAPAARAAATADPELGKAERLARIVISDIVLYNPDKFAAAVAAGNVVEALAEELAEGRTLFEQRITPALRAQRDFLVDELLRVARSRGMR
jgi:predicted Zn finger-like uncharacterized protein